MNKSLARTIVNRVTQETVTFIETAEETNYEYLLLEVKLPAHGEGPPLHYHKHFMESFECIEGVLTLLCDKERVEHKLYPGEGYSVGQRIPHTFFNKESIDLVFRVKLTPPSYFEESIRIHYGLMDDGLANQKGEPKKLIYTALILTLQNTRIAGIPIKLQTMLFNYLVRKSIKNGKYKSLEKYIGKSIESLKLNL